MAALKRHWNSLWISPGADSIITVSGILGAALMMLSEVCTLFFKTLVYLYLEILELQGQAPKVLLNTIIITIHAGILKDEQFCSPE